MKLRYGMIGMGPIGTVFATHLKQAGHPVSVLCYDENKLKSLQGKTISITGALEAKAELTDLFLDLDSFLASKPDVIFIATKTCDSLKILQNIRQRGSTDSTLFISCQNGLDVEDQIIQTFGSSRTLRLVLNLGCGLLKDTEVSVNWAFSHILSLRPEVTLQRTQQISSDLTQAGLKTDLTPNYYVETLKKALLNSSVGSICAITGLTMRTVVQNPELLELVRKALLEGIQIGHAMGLEITENYVNDAMSYFSKCGNHKPSIRLDLENGRQTENEYLCGKLYYYATQHQLHVPVIQTLYFLLKALEQTHSQPQGGSSHAKS